MEEKKSLPQLTNEEIRVLGSLIEKSRTTPENYPMTINSLKAACNQKSSRKPVVSYSESVIVETLDNLRKKGLVSTVVGGGARVIKYKHNVAIKFPLIPAELTVICLLFLRGPLTVGEINTNSNRLFEFDSLDEINDILVKLSNETEEQPAYIKILPKKSGQKESRFIHLFNHFEEEMYEFETLDNTSHDATVSKLEEKVSYLERELMMLREEFDKLLAQLT